jgi:hypothetical protein
VTYFPDTTGLTPLSEDHTEKVIPRIQRCCLEGGRTGNAVYRGFAKTTITENAAIWALLYGHRKYVAVFGADAPAAGRILSSIKSELSSNDLLLEDFPEVCHPIQSLEGKAQRCHSQTYIHVSEETGEEDRPLTHIQWTAEKIALPFIAGADGAGGVVSVHGLTAGSRGLKHKRPDGTNQRPDFVIIDDPQTDESAAQPGQCLTRINLITKNILKLAGHRKQLACVINATVIEPDDLVEQMMDPARHPSWQWVRVPMVKAWSTSHESHWKGEYARLRNDWNRDDPEDILRAWSSATDYYRQHRESMDAGCIVSWDSCFDPDTEISAIQHAYNMLIDDGEEVFASECQQQPKKRDARPGELTAKAIVLKANGLARGAVPSWATKLVSYIDVQDSVLYWLVLALSPDFSGHVVDYGIYPEQPRGSLMLADVKTTLMDAHPGLPLEGAIRAGLDHLSMDLLSRIFPGEGGVEHSISRLLCDSANRSDLVYEFTKRSQRASTVLPARGRFYGAATTPMSEYKTKEGEKLGDHWMIAPVNSNRSVRLFHIDTNYWKSFVYQRLETKPGVAGCYSMFGEPRDHDQFGNMLTAEHRVTLELVSGRGAGRKIDEWKLRPNRENHLFDCLVGASAAACEQGITLPGLAAPKKKRRRLTQEEVNAMRERGRLS